MRPYYWWCFIQIWTVQVNSAFPSPCLRPGPQNVSCFQRNYKFNFTFPRSPPHRSFPSPLPPPPDPPPLPMDLVYLEKIINNPSRIHRDRDPRVCTRSPPCSRTTSTNSTLPGVPILSDDCGWGGAAPRYILCFFEWSEKHLLVFTGNICYPPNAHNIGSRYYVFYSSLVDTVSLPPLSYSTTRRLLIPF